MSRDREQDSKRQLTAFRSLVHERTLHANIDWVQLEQDVSNREVFRDLMDALHTIEGEARQLGFAVLSNLAHALAGATRRVFEAGQPPDLEVGDHILNGLDGLTALSEREPDDPAPEGVALIAQLGLLPVNEAPGDDENDDRDLVQMSERFFGVPHDEPQTHEGGSAGQVDSMLLSLERHLLAHGDDDDARALYADRLQELGDSFGEFIAVNIAAEADGDGDAARLAFFEKHGTACLGAFADMDHSDHTNVSRPCLIRSKRCLWEGETWTGTGTLVEAGPSGLHRWIPRS